MDKLKLFSGNANRPLAERIAKYLEKNLGDAYVGRFPDGEINVKLEEDIRGTDVFIIQPTCPPVNENLMELLVLIDCFRRASAERITAVMPYYGYARKDRKDEGRVPITAKLVANLVTEAGADRVLAVDLHASQIQGFFDIPTDHLYAAPVLMSYFEELGLRDFVVVAPDIGSVRLSRAYSSRFDVPLAVVDKRRITPDETSIGVLIGDVKGKNVIMVDDMIATGGSVVEAARFLKEHGALDIYVGATHAVFCGPAYERLSAAPLKEVVVTDTIPLGDGANLLGDRLKVVSVAPLLAEAIKRIHFNQSVSELFKKPEIFAKETVLVERG